MWYIIEIELANTVLKPYNFIDKIERYIKTSENFTLVFNLLWCLSNIIHNNPILQDYIIEKGIYDRVNELLNKDCVHENIIKSGIWFLYCLNTPQPQQHIEVVKLYIYVLIYIVTRMSTYIYRVLAKFRLKNS